MGTPRTKQGNTQPEESETKVPNDQGMEEPGDKDQALHVHLDKILATIADMKAPLQKDM